MVTVISGTNRPENITRIFAEAYANVLRSKGEEVRFLSLEDLPAKFAVSNVFDFEHNGLQEVVETFIKPAHKIVIVVPEYNGSFPGIMKLFIDGMHPRFFKHKKVLLAGVSSGRAGNLRGLDHLTAIFHYMHAEVFSVKNAIAHVESLLNENLEINNEKTLNFIEGHVEKFLAY